MPHLALMSHLKDEPEPPPVDRGYQAYLDYSLIPARALYPRGHEGINGAQEVVGNDDT